ncbi:MAG: 4'-phosphopantetheinyl transferase superfamily protein [Verrucomicrobia bacterium]|nr:4'-phosphopantetheinyl transferase superfamily protein [Verrucomicrobiota bacterium]
MASGFLGRRICGCGRGGTGFFDAPVPAGEFFEDAEFLSGAAEENLDVVDRLSDFRGEVLGGDSRFAGGVGEFGDLGFEETARGAFGGFAGFGFGGAAAFALCADGVLGKVFFSGGEEFDLFFDFLYFGVEPFLFLGQHGKVANGLAAEVGYFHGEKILPYFHVAGQVFLLGSARSVEKIILNPNEIDVWRIGGEGDFSLLTESEKRRCEGFLDDALRKNFVRSRVGIRLIAREYTGNKVRGMDFPVSREGKPFLPDINDLHFNLSHSVGELAVAFSRNEVGFDIESKARRANYGDLARRFFDAAEARAVEEAGDSVREVFFRLWTAKEAVLKLEGTGISGGLQRALISSETSAELDGRPVFLGRVEWEGYAGAVASFQEIAQLRLRSLVL